MKTLGLVLKSFAIATASLAIVSTNSMPTLAVTGIFDFDVKIVKIPDGLVNVRERPGANQRIIGRIASGTVVTVTGGSCENAKTGENTEAEHIRSKSARYRKLKAPNVFCEIKDGMGLVGFVRGTHLSPM